MGAIPSAEQEEVIASKDVFTMGVLTRLMLSYQLGGLSEKAAILDSPEEAQGLQQAVAGLKWLRCHHCAGEVGVVRPDAILQAKGLGHLMRKVLKDNPEKKDAGKARSVHGSTRWMTRRDAGTAGPRSTSPLGQ